MKFFSTVLVISAILLSGCSMFTHVYKKGSGIAIITVDNPTMYAFKDKGIGDKIGTYTCKAMTEINYDGRFHRNSQRFQEALVVNIDGKKVVMKFPEIQTKWHYDVVNTKVNFSIPKERSEEIWSRAVSYINKNASMKIQTSSDYIIDTYNPLKANQVGFTITKEIRGDQVLIDVSAKIHPYSFNTTPSWEAQKCAYYLQAN